MLVEEEEEGEIRPELEEGGILEEEEEEEKDEKGEKREGEERTGGL